MAVILTHLKAQRIAKGFTQETLASAAGISTRTIQRIEKGEEAALETAKSISAALDCQSYHDLCSPCLEKTNSDNKDHTDKSTLLDAIKKMKLSERLPDDEGKFTECGEANEAVADHWIFTWRNTFFGSAVGVIMSLQLPTLAALLASIIFGTDSHWPGATGFLVTFFILVILPHLISTEALRKAQRLSYELNIDSTLSGEHILALHQSMKDKIARAESGDAASMYDVAFSLKNGGDMLPKNQKDALVILGVAAESGHREAAEALLYHFKHEAEGFSAYCKHTGLDARQAAYEAAIKAKSLGSLEAAQYIAQIESPPQKSIGLGTMLVGVTLGVAILS
tara:strand:- start:22938 stop:23951 length:1014 start_codon:yes stop_codon:yes gene_type:complete